jgi:excisionase family DNA binding protein
MYRPTKESFVLDMHPLRHPYQIPRYPTLLPLLPILKAIYQQTAPKEPEKTQPPEPPGEYMTTIEVAAYVKRNSNTIRQWCRENTFPYIVLPGGDRIFSKEMVDRWMEKRAFNVPAE